MNDNDRRVSKRHDEQRRSPFKKPVNNAYRPRREQVGRHLSPRSNSSLSLSRHGDISTEYQSQSTTRLHSQWLFVGNESGTRSSLHAPSLFSVDDNVQSLESIARLRSLSRSKFEIAVTVTDPEDEHYFCQC